MPKPPQTPEAPRPASGEPTRRVPNAGRLDDSFDPWASDDPRHNTRPMGEILPDHFAAATVQASTKHPALRRQSTDSGLGAGVPGPSFGGDTDFDATDEHHALRDTASFENRALESQSKIGVLSEPPTGPLALEGDFADEALDLVGRQGSLGPPGEPPRISDPMAELRERYALGDFSGALTIAEALLEDQPTNTDVQRYADSCREVLQQMYLARLGALHQVPYVAVPAEQLRWLTLDHRAGFLLSHVDGVSTLEEILDISGMPQLEAMRLIYELLQQKVILFQ